MSDRSHLIDRTTRTALLVLSICATCLAQGDSPTSRGDRLRSMPPARLSALTRNLQRFDELDSATREGIRVLDRQVEALDPVTRTQHLVVLQRFQVWFDSLPDARKQEFLALPDNESRLRFLADSLRTQPQPIAPNSPLERFKTHLQEFGPFSPLLEAQLVKTWFALSPEEQKTLSVHKTLNPELVRKLITMGQKRGIEYERWPIDDWLELLRRRRVPNSGAPNALAKAKLADPQLAATKAAQIRRILGQARYREAEYLAQNAPAPVTAANLFKFSVQLPIWMRDAIDPLPPQSAREALTILYRAVYPAGQEIPSPSSSKKQEGGSKKQGAPRAKETPAEVVPL